MQKFFLKAGPIEIYDRVKFAGDDRCCHQKIVPDSAGYKKIIAKSDHEKGLLALVNLQFNPDNDSDKRVRVQIRKKIHPKFIRFIDRRNEGCEIKFKKQSIDKNSLEYEIFENQGYFEHTKTHPVVYVPIFATDQNSEEMDINSQECMAFWKGKCPVEIKLGTYSGWFRTQKLVDVEE